MKKTKVKTLKTFRSIGSLIRVKRIEGSLSQKNLALKVGMRQPDISAIEAGKVNLTLESIMKLSRVLGIKEIPVSGRGGQV